MLSRSGAAAATAPTRRARARAAAAPPRAPPAPPPPMSNYLCGGHPTSVFGTGANVDYFAVGAQNTVSVEFCRQMALLYDGALLADTEFRGTLAAEVSAALGAPPAAVERASLHAPAALETFSALPAPRRASFSLLAPGSERTTPGVATSRRSAKPHAP